MRTDVMTEQDAETAAGWVEARNGQAFPFDCFPKTGISVYELRTGRLLAVVSLCFLTDVPIALLGWCTANPANSPRESAAAIRLGVAAAGIYAQGRGAKYLMSIYGNRGVNRILDRMGFRSGDRHAEHKMIGLHSGKE